jgi:hypothetical protein
MSSLRSASGIESDILVMSPIAYSCDVLWDIDNWFNMYSEQCCACGIRATVVCGSGVLEYTRSKNIYGEVLYIRIEPRHPAMAYL